MKKSITLFALILVINFSFGQSHLFPDSIIKPGLYKSFRDLLNNRPTEYKIPEIKESFNYGLKYDIENLISYNLDYPDYEVKEIGRIIGFSDGINIYLVANEPVYTWGHFYKAEFIGHFIFLDGVDERLNGGMGGASQLVFYQKIIDLKNGTITNLSVSNFKKMISDNPTLLEKFKKEKKKKWKIKDYFYKYVQN